MKEGTKNTRIATGCARIRDTYVFGFVKAGWEGREVIERPFFVNRRLSRRSRVASRHSSLFYSHASAFANRDTLERHKPATISDDRVVVGQRVPA